MTKTLSAAYVSLEVTCRSPECATFAYPLYTQLSSGRYDECSVMRLPDSIDEWQEAHRTARKRAWRAERLGYEFDTVQRHRYAEDIYAINTSLGERQGRPMSGGYQERPSDAPDPPYPCPRHGVHAYGVFKDFTLVAYLWCYRAGDMALVSSILGHGEHLANDVMYLLMRGALKRELVEPGYLIYNRHDSGTEGLRWFKERCGFEPVPVEWQP